MPLVSVCLTTRNQRRYISQCITSVLAQVGAFRLEVLVGDDASDDGTSDLVATAAREHRGVVFHVHHRERLGPSANTKSLVARASGQYIARLDGDDYWLEGKIAEQLRVLEAAQDCSAVYANAITADASGKPVGLFNDVGDIRLSLASLLSRGNFLNNSSMLCRTAHRAAWLSIPDPILDYRIHLMHARYGDILHIGRPLSVYRVATSGSMVSESSAQVRGLYWEAIRSVPRELVGDEVYAQGVADFLRRVLFRAARTGNFRLIKQWAGPVYAESPFGVARTTAMTLSNVCRMLLKISRAKVRGQEGGLVLYRR